MLDSITIDEDRLIAEAVRIGLDPNRIRLHFERIRMAATKAEAHPQELPIAETCRIDNGRIAATDWLTSTADHGTPDFSEYVAFVPAGGASTRYLHALQPLLAALEKRDFSEFERHRRAIAASEVLLPAKAEQLLTKINNRRAISPYLSIQSRVLLTQPKALFPCVVEGHSFLDMKLEENASLRGLRGQIFVAPLFWREIFLKEIARKKQDHDAAVLVLEQGPELSTLRFDPQGCPMRDKRGKLSLVGAGHGALIELFGRVRDTFGPVSLFIKNVDNVVGTNADATAATQQFLHTHRILLACVREIRALLQIGEEMKADTVARDFLGRHGGRALNPEESEFLQGLTQSLYRNLWELQLRVFHAPMFLCRAESREALAFLYRRPVNLLGQVPNLGNDVGGSPVVVRGRHGDFAVCLELPHVSLTDRETYLHDRTRATHFNPVFVATELTSDISSYKEVEELFWLLARKQWRGRDVVYHETLLFEIIGNSISANCVFIEIPRFLFNPHKVLADTRGKRLASWN